MYTELKFTRSTSSFTHVGKSGFVGDESFRYFQKGIFNVERNLTLNDINISSHGNDGVVTDKSKSYSFSLKRKVSYWTLNIHLDDLTLQLDSFSTLRINNSDYLVLLNNKREVFRFFSNKDCTLFRDFGFLSNYKKFNLLSSDIDENSIDEPCFLAIATFYICLLT